MRTVLSKVIHKLLPPYLSKDKTRTAIYQVNSDIMAHALTKIIIKHYELFGTIQDKAVNGYLNKLSTICSNFFEGSIYKVKLISSTEALHKSFPSELYLVVNSIGVHIFSSINFEKKRFILLSQLSGWTVSGIFQDQINLKFGNIRTPSVYSFRTNFAHDLSRLIADFISTLYPDVEKARLNSRAMRIYRPSFLQ